MVTHAAPIAFNTQRCMSLVRMHLQLTVSLGAKKTTDGRFHVMYGTFLKNIFLLFFFFYFLISLILISLILFINLITQMIL